MKILAVISARGGSKEVPRKNLLKLGDKPLIAHMLDKAKKCDLIDMVICSTDSQEIASVAKSYGVDVPFLRPKELAQDRTPLISSTLHAMKFMDSIGFISDIVIQLSPTCPFIKVSSIQKSIEHVLSVECESAVSLQKIEHEHPYRARKLMDNDYFENFIQTINVEAKQFHSRQDLPLLYCTSGGIYTRKRHLLDKYNGEDFAMGNLRKAVVLDEIESVNIDRMIDFQFAEFLISSNKTLGYI